MSITGFIVLFAVTWFICLWVMLPIGLRTQEDEGERVPGTQSGAPANLRFGRKVFWVTVIASSIWICMIAAIVITGVELINLDVMGVLETTK